MIPPGRSRLAARTAAAPGALALLALLLWRVAEARADVPPATATMQCEHATEPGRVRCTVEARARAGVAIRWGDVVIRQTAERVATLKGRIGPADATTRDDGVWRWALALVARERGSSDVRARVRLVVCEGERCAPFEADVVVPLEVGARVAP